MSYTPTKWVDHLKSSSAYNITPNDDGTYNITPAGEVIQQGTPISAENLNHMEQGIYDAVNENGIVKNSITIPDNPVTGQLYYNTQYARLEFYNGNEWETLNPTKVYTFSKVNEGVLQVSRCLNRNTIQSTEIIPLVDTTQFDSIGSAAAALASAKAYIDDEITKLLGGAPSAALDTLFELAEAVEANRDLISGLQAIASAGVHKTRVSCPALSPSSGVCIWVCNHGLTMPTSDVICKVYAQNGEEVLCDVTINSTANVIIRIASDEDIASGSYYAVFMG